jgi:hypothetical protein
MTSTMADVPMRIVVVPVVLVFLCLGAAPVRAQDPPPRIGPFVIDLHATVPNFPTDDINLALSHDVNLAELPGRGLGAQVGAHVYLLRLQAITFGVGAEFVINRASQMPAAGVKNARPAKEQFSSFAPQLSFNFGTGHGWSYLSGGLGQSTWSIIPEGNDVSLADVERLKTINYGGGGRWFMKSHLAFSFDVRFYAINPGTPYNGFASPRTRLLVIGAGISLK